MAPFLDACWIVRYKNYALLCRLKSMYNLVLSEVIVMTYHNHPCGNILVL